MPTTTSPIPIRPSIDTCERCASAKACRKHVRHYQPTLCENRATHPKTLPRRSTLATDVLTAVRLMPGCTSRDIQRATGATISPINAALRELITAHRITIIAVRDGARHFQVTDETPTCSTAL